MNSVVGNNIEVSHLQARLGILKDGLFQAQGKVRQDILGLLSRDMLLMDEYRDPDFLALEEEYTELLPLLRKAILSEKIEFMKAHPWSYLHRKNPVDVDINWEIHHVPGLMEEYESVKRLWWFTSQEEKDFLERINIVFNESDRIKSEQRIGFEKAWVVY